MNVQIPQQAANAALRYFVWVREPGTFIEDWLGLGLWNAVRVGIID